MAYELRISDWSSDVCSSDLIKNPLAGIKGAAQLLARKTDAGGELFTTLICAEVDRIATLIDQMEHFSRGQPIACGPIKLYQPTHQAMETARARQFSGVRFAEDFDPSQIGRAHV